jgi:hypothetical protein
MSEKRKPRITMLLKWEAKGKNVTTKVQLYDEHLFPDSDYPFRSKRFRVKLNGKWFYGHNKQRYFYKTEIRDILWRSIPFY